jgi:hypothetical protein
MRHLQTDLEDASHPLIQAQHGRPTDSVDSLRSFANVFLGSGKFLSYLADLVLSSPQVFQLAPERLVLLFFFGIFRDFSITGDRIQVLGRALRSVFTVCWRLGARCSRCMSSARRCSRCSLVLTL